MSDPLSFQAVSSVGGSYALSGAVAGENSTTQAELEFASSALYALSQRRLDYGISVSIPAMTEHLQWDASYATAFTSIGPDYRKARAGVANAIATQLSDNLHSALAGLSPGRRTTYLYASEQMINHAAAMTALLQGLSKSQEYESYRKQRDQGYEYLFGDIEQASKVRDLASKLADAGFSDMASAAKEAVDMKSHKLTMQQIRWEGERARKQLDDSSGFGAILGQVVSGVTDGMGAAKAARGTA